MELNMSNGHNFYVDMGADTTVVHGTPDLAVVRNNVSGSDVYLEVSGRGTDHFTAVDANELRDAIDKAAGKRKEDQRISAWDTIVTHDFFRSCFDADGALLDAMLWKLDRLDVNASAADSWYEVKNHDFFDDCYGMDSIARHKIVRKLDSLAAGERTGAKGSDPKPYRPIDRDRLLRHIEDNEAALARRNSRHERDQARIRELEAEVFTLREIKDSYEEPRTAREHLELAWEAATVPEDGMVHEGEQLISRLHSGGLLVSSPKQGERVARSGRLLDPRVEPTADEKRRAEYEAQGLKGWEIALLMEASMS